MQRVFGVDQLKLERKIVEDFGDGRLHADVYLFDQLSRLSSSGLVRIPVTDLLEIIAEREPVIAFFDRNPDNLFCVIRYLDSRYHQFVAAHKLSAAELAPMLLAAHYCDLYVLTDSGELMSVATHEDPNKDGVRQVLVLSQFM